MIFGLIILALVAVVAYYHWIQGIFSATISAILSICAAALALGWHEWMVDLALKGRMGDQAHAAVLVGMYAITYIALRFLFDGVVPGNIRVHALVDKIGGAAMGAIAGMFAAGIFVIAAQQLPFGPAILDYARCPVSDVGTVAMKVPGKTQMQELGLMDVLAAPSLEAKYSSGLLLPVDDMVVGTVRALSDGGALAGPRAFADLHPDFLAELFGQRLGFQPGSLRTAFSAPGQEQVKVLGAYRLDQANQQDAESPEIAKKLRDFSDTKSSKVSAAAAEQFKREWDLSKIKKSDKEKLLLVIRVQVDQNIADSNNLVALSPGSVRLVAGRTNYHPIGTYENRLIYRNRLDDSLFVPVAAAAKAVDFVFEVKKADVLADPSKENSPFRNGAFVEVKRLARLPLSSLEIGNSVESAAGVEVLRKNHIARPATP